MIDCLIVLNMILKLSKWRGLVIYLYVIVFFVDKLVTGIIFERRNTIRWKFTWLLIVLVMTYGVSCLGKSLINHLLDKCIAYHI